MSFRRQRWEYYELSWFKDSRRWKWDGRPHEEYSKFELLSELGAQGWELVAIVSHMNDGTTFQLDYTFKRKA